MDERRREGEMSIWAQTNLDTRIAFSASACCTASEIRELIRRHHLSCFPAYGEIDISALMARKKTNLYHIVDSMRMGDVFENTKGIGFLMVEVSDPRCDAQQAPFSPNPLMTTPVLQNQIDNVTISRSGHDILKEHKRRGILFSVASRYSEHVHDENYCETTPPQLHGSYRDNSVSMKMVSEDSESHSGNRTEKILTSMSNGLSCKNMQKRHTEKCQLEEAEHSEKDFADVIEAVTCCAKRRMEANEGSRWIPEKSFLISPNGPSSLQPSASEIHTAPCLWPTSSANRHEHHQDKGVTKAGSKLYDANHKMEEINERQLARERQNTMQSRIKCVAVSSHCRDTTNQIAAKIDMTEKTTDKDLLVMENGVSVSAVNKTLESNALLETEQFSAESIQAVSEANEVKMKDLRRGQLTLKKVITIGRDLEETHETDRIMHEDMEREEPVMSKGVSSDDDLNAPLEEETEPEVEYMVNKISETNVVKVGDMDRGQFIMNREVAAGSDQGEDHDIDEVLRENMVKDQPEMQQRITSDDDLRETNGRKKRHRVGEVRSDRVNAMSELSGMKGNDTRRGQPVMTSEATSCRNEDQTSERQIVLKMEQVSAAALERILEDDLLAVANRLSKTTSRRKQSASEHWPKKLGQRLVQAKKECLEKDKKDDSESKRLQDAGTSEAVALQAQTPVHCEHCGRQYAKRTSSYFRHLEDCQIQRRQDAGTSNVVLQQLQTSVQCDHCGKQYMKKTSSYYRHVKLCK
eukprot:Gb_05869 [translate_table: standard]